MCEIKVVDLAVELGNQAGGNVQTHKNRDGIGLSMYSQILYNIIAC